jgi:pimeloyl-ACP methyl ester carboxylesterase
LRDRDSSHCARKGRRFGSHWNKGKAFAKPCIHASIINSLEQRGLEDTWKTFWSGLFSDASDSQVVNAAKRIALRQPLEEVVNEVNVFHSRPSRDQSLSSLSCPVFVVRGADDTAPGPRTSEAQAASIQHGQLHILPNCGHYVSMERPEDLKSILRNVIAAQSKVDV